MISLTMFGWTKQLEKQSRAFFVVATVFLVIVVGVIDYATSPEISFSVFYLLAVGVAAWFVGKKFAWFVSAFCVAVSVVGDIASGSRYSNQFVPFWNESVVLGFYFVVVSLLTRLRSLTRGLEARVQERTAALTGEMKERERLERELLEISEREQRRIGHDLHDSLCQHWAATAMAGQVLCKKLADKSVPEMADAKEIVRLAEAGMTLTRNLAHDISPAEMENEGLVTALREFAANTSKIFNVECQFDCETPPEIRNATTGPQLYRIAQEAVQNAIRHGKPKHVIISLSHRSGHVDLTIEDDGCGLPDDWQNHRGLGTRIMAHRATMIGGNFSIEPNPTGGTFVKCSIPVSAGERKVE